jgi:hypothetical protein
LDYFLYSKFHIPNSIFQMYMDPEMQKLAADVAEIRQTVKKIKNHFLREEIYRWFLIILVVVPTVIGFFMVWPMLKGAWGQYQQLLGMGQAASQVNITDLEKNISPDLLKQLEALKNK